ncbi:hypothetical protein CTAYLR_007305 [Chrysophaeum taylorii]|uniref:Band 3 cytoplasmic domain-containing protein n=1 Tax=Chrysophaeum taylorii TaxID=2483200 RepID=A0AAD7UIT6_9STRA|nr:hypothetical protein CTAYLR_007305 [Chrysophaeum taylorii]
MGESPSPSEHVLDLKNMQVDEKNLVMFRKKHLFVEMHELGDKEWHETHRWNYGLEEDLRGQKWTSAHLPTISVFGMMALRERLRPELVILDVATDEDSPCGKKMRTIALEIVNHLVRDGQIDPGNAADALEVLHAHFCLKKCVDHDARLKEEALERKLSHANLQAHAAMSRKHSHANIAQSAPVEAAMPPKSTSLARLSSLVNLVHARQVEEPPPPPPEEEVVSQTPRGGGGGGGGGSLLQPPRNLRSISDTRRVVRRKSALQRILTTTTTTTTTTKKKQPERITLQLPAEDPLRPDAEEEAVHVLIDDQFNQLKSDAVVVVRLLAPIASGLEERLDYDDEEGGKQQQQDLLARFIVLVLGPRRSDASSEAGRHLQSHRHSEMGAAAAALMQDDAVVRALYEATNSRVLLEAIDLRLSAMRVLPQTSRPTKKAVHARASRMYQQLAELRRVAEEQAQARLRESEIPQTPVEVVGRTNTAGRFLRLEYPDQGAKWGARAKDSFTYGFSVGAFFSFAQKYALPLLTGIVLALVLANARAGGYRRWAGVHEEDDDNDHRRRLSSSSSSHHPTVFGLSINDHDVTLHFIVNDVLMAFFFGLAVKEIAEAFQPGGSLYPPSKRALNPMLGTVGGVLGPVLVYLLLLALATLVPVGDGGDPLLAASYADLAKGWGIPTATDISVAWVTAVVVFGSGHPAINFLLLCAVIDDGIGLLIIAIAYQDPDHPLNPVWLLLVVLAMLISYVLRRLQCGRWQMYVVLAGPFAWLGLLYANVHASLALCFVVPFMPIKIQPDDVESLNGDVEEGYLSIVDGHITSKDVRHTSPLHDFEESVKDFVDFCVLFAFGAVNAGVDLQEVGGLSFIIVLALVLGKTLGMSVGSSLAVRFGYGRPDGMSFRHLVISGVISSVGLTVSLFIAGEAFPNDETYEDQAKLGALLSVLPSLVLVALANFSTTGRRALVGIPVNIKSDFLKHSTPAEHLPDLPTHDTGTTPKLAAGLAGDGIPASPAETKDPETGAEKDVIDYEVDYPEEEVDQDEDLEDVVVRNIQKTLKEIHRIEKQVETRAGVRRSSSMLNAFHHTSAHLTNAEP